MMIRLLLARKDEKFPLNPMCVFVSEGLYNPGANGISAFHFLFAIGTALWILLCHIPCLENKTIGLYDPVLREEWVRIPVSQRGINLIWYLRLSFSCCLYATFLLCFAILAL